MLHHHINFIFDLFYLRLFVIPVIKVYTILHDISCYVKHVWVPKLPTHILHTYTYWNSTQVSSQKSLAPPCLFGIWYYTVFRTFYKESDTNIPYQLFRQIFALSHLWIYHLLLENPALLIGSSWNMTRFIKIKVQGWTVGWEIQNTNIPRKATV